MKTIVLKTVNELIAWRKGLAPGARVGFVPTMGALHSGHASLLERARSENDVVVLSIFVNPTQFNQASDLEKYPRTLKADLETAEAAGVDAVFVPKDSAELYPEGYRYRVIETELSKELCGAHRPGHFDGVLTVVLKLFGLVRARRAYFGEKDFQQLSLIRGMAHAFFLETEVVGCPTVRETDGLAMSSRNLRLSPAEREVAPKLHAAMTSLADLAAARRAIEDAGFRIDYLEDRVQPTGEIRRFVAATLGEIRLIDNIALPESENFAIGGPV
ncbi:MAG: pantoate--beta-alanine ligase [Bdellovibrionales bacterium]|nr:pantoate--beta-alanine ligase [Bdellovibrionales bacterium]